jgi:nitrogen regulatory protein P-II 1
MKKIEAIIREDKFAQVKHALEDKGFISMTISDVYGRGQQKGVSLKWRAGEHRIEFLPKKKIEIVIEDEDAENVIEIICDNSHTGVFGDGKIFVMPVEEAVRIRTRETGAEAV